MDFRILGRLDVRSDEGEPIAISQPLLRAAICVLVLKADRPLTSDQLGELLWDEGAGRKAGALKTGISGVRRLLTTARLPPGHGGYRLRLDDHDTLDLRDFRALGGQAREAAGRGDDPLAAELYERALALWGVPPLEDLPRTSAMSGIVTGLLAERRLAREDLARARLVLGRHRELLPELRSWVTEEPLNEHLWARLLLALYRSGHKAEALQAYDEAQNTLVNETGAEPGPELQRMWHRVKVDDPELAHRAHKRPAALLAPPLARQLPPDIRDFTGRDAECERMRRLLSFAPSATAPPIVCVTGAPGLGKTALAVHVAHLEAASFPDGQLYLQLTGASSAPRDPAVVLNEVLRAVGVAPSDIPDTLAERAALYRSRLAGRRVLVVADDAAGPEQVLPLLPGAPGSAVIVTSRIRSPSPDGAHLVDLERLPPDAGVRMLTRIVGRGRVAADPAAADRIVSACDGFPLAVRIAGARLAARPSWPLAHLAGLLLEEGRRLDHLTAVRAHIEAAYDSLDEPSRRAFRMLALAGPHDVAPWVIEVLVGDRAAADAVDGLVDRSLLTTAGVDAAGQPRYRLHDLLREYAAERLAEDPEREPALERLTLGWLELVDAADARVPRDPYFPAPTRLGPRIVVGDDLVARLIEPDAAAWLDSELANLRTAVVSACAAGRFRLATGLVLRLAAHLHLRRRHDEAEYLWRAVLEAAGREGDTLVAAHARLRAATVIAADRGRPSDAMPLIDACIAGLEGLPYSRDLPRALGIRAYGNLALGALEAARRDAERGLVLACGNEDPYAAFTCLRVLGLVLSVTGDHQEAAKAATESLTIARDIGIPAFMGLALYTLVRVHLTAGSYEEIPALCEEGLQLTDAIGHSLGEAYFYEQWGYAHQGLGDHDRAVRRLLQAAELFDSQEALAAGAACRRSLADSYRALGRHKEARAQLEWCLAAYGELDDPEAEEKIRARISAP
ncbi:BTAD domain-containing putative transcriptional regulator [Spirillospora sp. CA-255316]